MSKSKPTKTPAKPAPAQKDLKQVSLHINAFGEIIRDVKTDHINTFLDENVPDKKLSEP
mgnify:CR=1 FL=1